MCFVRHRQTVDRLPVLHADECRLGADVELREANIKLVTTIFVLYTLFVHVSGSYFEHDVIRNVRLEGTLAGDGGVICCRYAQVE